MKHIIVYGPKGCGKSYNRMAIAKHFDATVVIDDWRGNIFFQPNVKGPFTDGKVVKCGWGDASCSTVLYLYTMDYAEMLPKPTGSIPDLQRIEARSYESLASLTPVNTHNNVTIPDDASIFASSRNETDNAPAVENDYVDDEDLMRTIIDAYDELRDRGYDVSISNHPDPALLANTNTTHVTLIKKLKGEPK